MSSSKWVVNAVIVVVLLFQILPTLSSMRLYPFIDYPMYSARGYAQPVEAIHADVMLVTESGERTQLLPDSGQELSRGVSEYGFAAGVYYHQYMRPMALECDSERSETAAADLGERLNRHAEDPVLRIEIATKVYRLEDNTITERDTISCDYDVSGTRP